MSLLGSQVFANPTTALWGGGGGGGGSNLIVPPGGQITFQGTPDQVLKLDGGNITALDASGNLATTSAGEFRAYDTVGSYVGFGSTPALGLGIRSFIDDGTLQNTFATFGSGGWDLSNVTTINGSAYPPALATYPTNRFTLSNNSGATVLAAGTPVVGIYYEPTANGRVYANANCSFTNPGSNVSPSAGLTVAANLAVSDIVSVPAVASGLNTSASVQWEFGVQAGVAYDFVATATAGVDGDFRANNASLFLSFIPS